MIDCIISIVFSKWFFINWIIGILLCEFALYKTRAVRHVVEERDSKYPAFRRNDVKNWSRPVFYIGILLKFNF